MKYYKFSRVIHPTSGIINEFSKNLKIEISDSIINDGTYLIGGPRFSKDYLRTLEDSQTKYINIDKGYFKNRKSTSHWRLSVRGLQQNKFFNAPDDRIKEFSDLEIKQWCNKGSYILILAPNPDPLEFYCGHRDTLAWSLDVKNELLKYTDRKIFIRFKNNVKKSQDKLIKYFDDCYAVVSLQSIGAVEAVLHGIPAINLAPSCIDLLYKTNLADIENLKYPEHRFEWIKCLSYSQFTVSEISAGYAFEMISKYYLDN